MPLNEHCADRALFPLSFSQRNVYDTEAVLPGLPINNICSTLHIKGRVDAALIRQSALELVLRTPALRTRITLNDGEPAQYICDELPADIPLLDFSRTGEEGLTHWSAGVAREVLPLRDSPLVYIAAFILSPMHGGILLKTHHILSDAWSQALLADRFSTIYQALLAGTEIALPEPPPYAPHVANEREYLSGAQHAGDLAYFREQCARLSPCGELQKSAVGRRLSKTIPERVSRLIAAYCEEKKLSPFAVFYMALNVYLRRVMGQENPCVGVPVLGRRTFTEKQTIGMFVSTLPFACDIPLSASANEFQRALLEDWYALLKHQRAPYREIAQIAREAGIGEPLFSVALSYQNARLMESSDSSVRFEGRWQYSGYQRQTLCLHLSDREGEGAFLADYDYLTQAYSQDDIERMHGYLVAILRGALDAPDMPLNRVRLLSQEEEDGVLYRFNRTRARFPDVGNLGAWLTAVCAEHPVRVAVISGGRRVTYRVLFERAEAVARGVCACVQERESVVGVLMPRDETLFVALCGVLLSGRAFCLVDGALPPERKVSVLTRAGAALLICGAHEGAYLPDGFIRTESIETLSAMRGEITSRADADTLACVDCTSGTTGVPKAVAIEQKSLINFARAMRPYYAQGAVLSLCGVGFDAFLIESVCALCNARTVIFASEREMNEPSALAALITGFAAGFLALTPSRLFAYMENSAFCAALARLEVVLLGGERFPEGLEAALRARTDARIYNQYGPTETCVGVACKLLGGDGARTVGKPMPNCRAYVLSEAGDPLPVGAPGRLFLGGVCVARGYIGDERETAARFLRDPFSPPQRMYDSGDIARWTENGELEILGRADRQTKVRGLRIEPGDIEARLLKNKEVSAAAVAVRGQTLIAWYMGACAPEDARAFARAGLPEYMVPARFINVPTLPLTKNGKIDYDMLPDSVQEIDYQEAQTDAERALLSLFRKKLGNERLSVTADFFQSGGDSLSALSLLAEAGARMNKRLDMQTLKAHASARALAKLLSGGEASVRETPYKRAPERADYPLTAQQQGLFALYLQEPSSLAYNMPGAYRIAGELSSERLESALRALIALDETLRTGFFLAGGQARMKIYEQVDFALETLDAPDWETALARFTRPFDLAKPPLLRAARFGDALLIDMHHIISDGLSGALLMKRLDTLYKGETPRMPAVRYRDIACAQETRDLSAQRDFYRQALSGAKTRVDLAEDCARRDTADMRAGIARETLSKDTKDKLLAACSALGVTPFSALFTAFAALLYRLCAQDDLVIGTPVSLRDDESVQEVTGLLIAPVPLRAKVSPDATFAALCKDTHARVLAMLDNRALPLSEIVTLSGAERREGQNPLYNVLFSYLPVDGSAFSMGEARLCALPNEPSVAKLDLSLEVAPRGEGLCVSVEYARALFLPETAQMLARAYAALVADALDCQGKQIALLRACARADYMRLIERPRRLRTPYERAPISAMIARACALCPEDAAVRWGDGRVLTYAELWRRSCALASRMRGAGAVRGTRVGVLAKRSEELLVALCAATLAGCAYVPLDTAYPAERIAYMLTEAEARLTLVSDGLALPEGFRALAIRSDEQETPFEPPADADAGDELYILYTSGSTGRPKGVAVTNDGVANLLCDLRGLMDFDGARILACANVIFDIFTIESVIALSLGKCVCVADEEEMRLPWKMAERVRKDGVNILQLTPSRMRMCLSDARFREALGQLSLIFLAGEAFSESLLADIRKCTSARIVNLYGPTEATVFASFADLTDARDVVIGKPVSNSRFYLLDEHGAEVPPLSRGEVYIAGACVAKGYCAREDLTRERFLPDPFVPGERMYKSGDIARLRADGNFQYLGRADRQLKIDGLRIEPEETCAQLLLTGLCKEAAVVPEYRDGQPRALRAYVVPEEGFTEQKALAALAPKLPAYLLPASVTALRALPRTPSGKTDLRALEALCASPQDAAAPALSASPLKDIWREALSREPEEEVSFFAQGGTSLAAVAALSRYYQLGMTFSLNDFYNHPTLREQIALLDGQLPKAPAKDSPALLRAMPDSPPLRNRPGCVLLTGASGFLGEHLLKELRARGERVLCLVHKGSVEAPCETVRGDITKERMGLEKGEYAALCARVSRVWHCAANVSHYASDEREILSANIDGTRVMLAFARDAQADFHFISTLSVAGDAQGFCERDLFVGQNALDNAYTKSKLLAEQAVAEAMLAGQPARVYRVGRLCARARDGVFQKRPETNAFYRVMRGLAEFAALPEGMVNVPVEMTSVDLCARACVLLSACGNTCLHVLNPRRVPLLAALRAVCAPSIMENAAFEALMRARAATGTDYERAAAEFYFGGDHEGASPDARETLAVLDKLGFVWPEPDAKLLLSSLTNGEG